MFRRVLALGLFVMAGLPAIASTIISETATSNQGFWPAPAYVGWSQTSTYTGVNISVNLASNGLGTASGYAYLLNTAPAPSVTSASQVGSPVAYSIPSANTAFSSVPLFTGLTLGAGTYYVVVDNGGGNTLVQSAPTSSTTVVLGAGATAGTQGIEAGTQAAYPPNSPFFSGFTIKGQYLLFSVTGNPATSVPAMSLWAMLATALLLAGSGMLLVRKFTPAA